MKKWIFALALTALVIFFSVQIYSVWTRSGTAIEDGDSAPADPSAPNGRKAAGKPAPASRYDVITGKNLFTKERGTSETEDPVVNPKASDASRYAKNIALYGVIIQSDSKSALVSSGKSRRSADAPSWVKVGDKIEQVTVVGIEADRIYVREGGSTFEVKIDDRDHPHKRAKIQRPARPTVISTKSVAKPAAQGKTAEPNASAPESESTAKPQADSN